MDIENLYKRILEDIYRYKMIDVNDSLLLSLSAGKDSMALLHILNAINSELKCKFFVFHLNHLTRGEENNRDESFIKKMVSQYEIPLYIKKFDFRETSSGSFEERARNKRYELLKDIAVKNKINRIVTAHSLNDNIETILMRLLNGTSLQGMQGIMPVRGNIIRPLLSITSSEIYEYLIKFKLEWREDESNKDNHHTRNYLRNAIIPLVEKKFPHYEKSVKKFIEVNNDFNNFFNGIFLEKIDKYISREDDIIKILIAPEIDHKNFIINIIISIIKNEINAYVKSSLIKEIYKKYEVNRSNLVLYENKQLIIKKIYLDGQKYLEFVRTNRVKKIKDWEYYINLNFSKEKVISLKEPGLKIKLKWTDFNDFEINMSNPGIIFLNVAQNDNLIVRSRILGDKIISKNGKYIKIKKYCIDNKCNIEEKKRLPIFVINDILVAAGFGFINKGYNRINHDFFVNDKTKKILAIYCSEKI